MQSEIFYFVLVKGGTAADSFLLQSLYPICCCVLQ